MAIQFKIVPKDTYKDIIPLVFKLNSGKVSNEVLEERFEDMKLQNYECAGIYDKDQLIGVSGLWFSTRHYTGKSAELDHVYIEEDYRNSGLGKRFMTWIKEYIQSKGCQAFELNTYVQNYPSHKFYYNQGMEIWGYHFIKKF
ncbi:GNAT family N-acetyltransferase [Winogradskyella sp. A3E31]|uniref:GNAT family N-acetyltransferase n=1 Tax=Winogradskyella sp. A3E31 TaxID=3349637 RepID=UPI00398B5092